MPRRDPEGRKSRSVVSHVALYTRLGHLPSSSKTPRYAPKPNIDRRRNTARPPAQIVKHPLARRGVGLGREAGIYLRFDGADSHSG